MRRYDSRLVNREEIKSTGQMNSDARRWLLIRLSHFIVERRLEDFIPGNRAGVLYEVRHEDRKGMSGGGSDVGLHSSELRHHHLAYRLRGKYGLEIRSRSFSCEEPQQPSGASSGS